MTSVSKNWKFNLTSALEGEVVAIAQGSFNLVAAAALTYIDRVYWTAPAVKADAVTEYLHSVMAGLNYGKSSKYALTSAALALARNWSRKYGAPNAVKERNVFWNMVCETETYGELIDFVVSAIKTDYSVQTMGELYNALKGNAQAKPTVEKSLADRVKASLSKGETADASAAALVALPFLAKEDKMTAFAAMVDAFDADAVRAAFDLINARMLALNAAAEAANVQTVEERGEELKGKKKAA